MRIYKGSASTFRLSWFGSLGFQQLAIWYDGLQGEAAAFPDLGGAPDEPRNTISVVSKAQKQKKDLC